MVVALLATGFGLGLGFSLVFIFALGLLLNNPLFIPVRCRVAVDDEDEEVDEELPLILRIAAFCFLADSRRVVVLPPRGGDRRCTLLSPLGLPMDVAALRVALRRELLPEALRTASPIGGLVPRLLLRLRLVVVVVGGGVEFCFNG